MIINDFSIDVIAKHHTWYLLKNDYLTDITIVRPTPVGPEPYNDCSAYRMADNRVLLGFNRFVATVLSQGLIAIGENGSEYITTQIWERISEICVIQPPNNDLGTFAFVDSQPPSILEPHKDWRCDKEYYGPYPYPTLDGQILDPFSESSVIVAFEPILSLAGVGHLIYMQRTNYKEQRNQLVNNAITPMTAPTLGETLKLIYEWSLVAGTPFNNQELIAQDARDFIRITGLTAELISPYPNMQIAKFILGDDNARVRPSNAIPPQVELIEFIQKSVSHISLTRIAILNPSIWNSDEIGMKEQELIQYKKDSFLEQHGQGLPKGTNINDLESVVPTHLKEILIPFFTEWLSLINKSYNV